MSEQSPGADGEPTTTTPAGLTRDHRDRIRSALKAARSLIGLIGLALGLVGGIGAEVIAWSTGYPKPPFDAVVRSEYQPWAPMSLLGFVLIIAGFGVRAVFGRSSR